MKEKQLLSFEVFPPKTDKGMENLPGTIEKLCEFNPEYISCTYGAGGGNVGRNREVCQEIIKAGTVTGNALHRYQKYKGRHQAAAGAVSGRGCRP